jgi:signal transduction histidine kinase
MSLRVRLVALILTLVALVAVSLAALELKNLVDSLSTQAIERSDLAGDVMSTLLLDYIRQRSVNQPASESREETKQRWIQIVSEDPDVARLVGQILALSPSVLEISVAGETGTVLVSSNPAARDAQMVRRQDFGDWKKNHSWYQQALDLIRRRPDWQFTNAVGILGQDQPMFTIQVVTSSVLVRDALIQQLKKIATITGGAVLISLLLTLFATSWILLPLRRIERTIDRIVQGNFLAEEPASESAKEFRVVESKLTLLGQQFRGTREHATELRHDVDLLLQRMASQLDVATRLAAISQLTGGVAHEIKNPLNAIILRLDLLRARLGAPEEELVKEIDILSKEVLRLDRVVKAFLDFSRPLEVNLEEVDLAALAGEVAELITPQARLARIAIEFEATSEPSETWMRGDADLLKQALLNLATNAMEAMPGGGLLRITVGRIDDKLILDVADNGPGIPVENRQKVFQLHFTTKKGGSGLGLAMTYRAVQLHNGTISFTSEAGAGTAFRVEFPATVQHA